jgi:hypothetical protein
VSVTAYRIVEHQGGVYSHAATTSVEGALQLDILLEASKPGTRVEEWHGLIATPFRYPGPSPYLARFKPPETNLKALYCSEAIRTAMYEHGFHFLKERTHLPPRDETGLRTLFSLFIHSARKVTDLTKHHDVRRLTDRRDYSVSHQYVRDHPETKAVKYPSCRDPEQGPNYAVFDITLLEKRIGFERHIGFSYSSGRQSLFWIEERRQIFLSQVQ